MPAASETRSLSSLGDAAARLVEVLAEVDPERAASRARGLASVVAFGHHIAIGFPTAAERAKLARAGGLPRATVQLAEAVVHFIRNVLATVPHGARDEHDVVAARAVQSAGGSLVKTTGDGVLATFAGPSHAMAAVRELQESAVLLGVSIRAGVHTGEIERRADDIGGIGVHIAARLADMAASGEVLVSRTTRDLAVGSKIDFHDRGLHTLKGVPEPWQVFAARC